MIDDDLTIYPPMDQQGIPTDCTVLAIKDSAGIAELTLVHPDGRQLAVYLSREQQERLADWLYPDCDDGTLSLRKPWILE